MNEETKQLLNDIMNHACKVTLYPDDATHYAHRIAVDVKQILANDEVALVKWVSIYEDDLENHIKIGCGNISLHKSNKDESFISFVNSALLPLYCYQTKSDKTKFRKPKIHPDGSAAVPPDCNKRRYPMEELMEMVGLNHEPITKQ